MKDHVLEVRNDVAAAARYDGHSMFSEALP
jgi:hypothetical protein